MTGSLLEFVQPATAKLKAQPFQPEKWLHAHYSDVVLNAGQLLKLATPSAYRNVLAWYLRAAGLPTADIANHLSISPSRVNAVALHAQKSFYKGAWNIAFMTKEAKSLNLRNDQLASHMLLAKRDEMRIAEGVLDRCGSVSRAAISASLQLGRQAYLDAWKATAGVTCTCQMCRMKQDGLAPYWETLR